MNWIEKKVEEFDLLQGGFDWWNNKPKREKAQDWLRATLTTYGNDRFEEGVKAERERIVAWACTHNMPDNMPDDARAGYNEALIQLTTNLQSDK